MSEEMEHRLHELPAAPGVYMHKDREGSVIYIGKAANLRTRVRSYFQKSRQHDYKTRILIQDIADIDWMETASEVEALFLESEMIKRHQPKYNIELRDNKQFLYVKITNDEFPRVWFTRRPFDDGAEYYGPFTDAFAVRKALRQLRRSFPYVTHRTLPERACLHYHIGLCPGPEVGAITPKQYRANLGYIKRYLRGKGGAVVSELEKRMNRLSREQSYEEAAAVRNQLHNLKSLSRQHVFGDQELFDLQRDQSLRNLREFIGAEQIPRRIECYDVSHLQGTDNVASMVVFTDGLPNRGEYRKFKLRAPGNDDVTHMREVITRRLKRWDQWPKPDVMIIDGGKGQVQAALEARDEAGIDVPVIGLAKRFEYLITKSAEDGSWQETALQRQAQLLKLLQRARDEAHRFAVTYHAQLRSKRQTSSRLESIPGVGPVTRKKLLATFGSLRGIRDASRDELAATVGPRLADSLIQYIHEV
jgi:excinuclease ABC subunit C